VHEHHQVLIFLLNGLLIFGILCLVTLLIFPHSLHSSAQLNVSISVIFLISYNCSAIWFYKGILHILCFCPCFSLFLVNIDTRISMCINERHGHIFLVFPMMNSVLMLAGLNNSNLWKGAQTGAIASTDDLVIYSLALDCHKDLMIKICHLFSYVQRRQTIK